MIQIGSHLHMLETMDFHFFKRLPMQPLKESRVLVLNCGEELMASNRIRRRNCFINQSGPEGSQPMITGLHIPN